MCLILRFWKGLWIFHSSGFRHRTLPIFMKQNILLRKMFPVQQIHIGDVYSFTKYFLNFCTEMQSTSADALRRLFVCDFVYQILTMAFRSSVNDVNCSNVSFKIRNEVVFWGAYCQTNCEPETNTIQMNFSDHWFLH